MPITSSRKEFLVNAGEYSFVITKFLVIHRRNNPLYNMYARILLLRSYTYMYIAKVW